MFNLQEARYRAERADQAGNAMVMTMVIMIMLSALAVAYLIEGVGQTRAEAVNRMEMALLEETENALQYNFLLMAQDPMYAVKDTTEFTVNDQGVYEGREQELEVSGGKTSHVRFDFQFMKDGAAMIFPDRSNPGTDFDEIRVFATANKAWLSRTVLVTYGLQISESVFGGAIISDAIPSGSTGAAGKAQAGTGDVVLSGKGRDGQQYVIGNLKANGEVRYYQDTSETAVISTDNADTYLGSLTGTIDSGLAGTAEEIPDITNLSGSDQLFDFDRFLAAQAAGAGTRYTSLADFSAAMTAANTAGTPLEGIIVLDLDPAVEGSKPHLKENKAGGNSYAIPGGININGTLVFHFKSGTPDDYKVFIEAPVNINGADLTNLDPADETTYTTGYPPSLSESTLAPWDVDISPTYDNFTSESDLPALMFNTGVVDLHGATNICGVVYGPSFIEIENKSGNVQYFNGAIIGGSGVYVEGNSSSGFTAIKQDFVNAVANLETKNDMGKVLTQTGFMVIR